MNETPKSYQPTVAEMAQQVRDAHDQIQMQRAITNSLSGVRKAAQAVNDFRTSVERASAAFVSFQLPPSKLADRRTIHVLGKPMHYYEVAGQLHLAKGESPWT